MKLLLKKVLHKLGKENFYLFLVDRVPLHWVKYLKKYFWFHEIDDGNKDLIKLNLGCGDKILEGYINVDVVASRRGHNPDVLCDLRKLKFEDNYADEILNVHVIEHFYRWEVEALLHEWMRVLKPGGRIVVECPNIVTGAKMLLRDVHCLDKTGSAVKESLWVMYGDPGWKDPYMIHRWGYSPESLTKLLTSVGFCYPKKRAALFKRREPRDMRVEAFKPI